MHSYQYSVPAVNVMYAVQSPYAVVAAGLAALGVLAPITADAGSPEQVATTAWTGWWSTVTFSQVKQCREVRIPADVLFGSDSAQPGPGLHEAVAEAVHLAATTEGPVTVLGYLDDRGPENIPLSQARADNVAEELVAEGVDRDRIVATGRGEADPVATNATASGRAQNRRVEIRVGECSERRALDRRTRSGSHSRERYLSVTANHNNEEQP